MNDRPTGVTILAIIAFFAGLVGLCFPLSLLISSGFADFGVAEELLGIDSRVVLFGTALLLLIRPILYLIFSYGALGLKPWAWWVGIVAATLALVGGALNTMNADSLAPNVAVGVIDVIIFIYLLTPHVRKAFGIGRKSAPAAAE
ncbi:MAG: hypothetical protein M9928_15095 [Anaerolineae bacterium]|nr:hypothetical protein [Anaerolineae bacterium]MCO5188199.1 hypothetical protein [Anaerolineae bacterium]MCO5194376.1 hypothetical protein [Anaerolineae bacterium]MCO5198098.1 hypothetical protein [Anaerolineae bacterium]MCO5206360.1 hypothetical protein [Anaerolineae bacterium]